MRFAHIADTHIRNLKYHYEYREVFNQLYDLLKEKKVELLLIFQVLPEKEEVQIILFIVLQTLQ